MSAALRLLDPSSVVALQTTHAKSDALPPPGSQHGPVTGNPACPCTAKALGGVAEKMSVQD